MTTADDERWEQRLREVAMEADPPPSSVMEAARAALAMRTVDAELAALVADSWVDADAAATRAVTSDVRMLTFACGSVTIELDVETDPITGVRSLRGIAVGAVGPLSLVRPGGRTTVPTDSAGGFALTGQSSGPARLEAATVDGGRVTTTWVVL